MSPYVRVIPLLRTPIGVDGFDYRVPAGSSFAIGDLVTVPFRKQRTVAVISEHLNTSPFATRAADVIGRYANLRFPETSLRLLEWIASRTYTSKPSVLKSWLRNLPVRPVTTEQQPKHPSSKEAGSIRAHWTNAPQIHLVTRAKELVAEDKRVLIITPWKTRVSWFQQELPDAGILHSELADGEAFRAWQSFLEGSTRILITTRLGAWLSPMADVVLIDEPENDDHKQDELAPRYDARLMAAWSGTHGDTQVESFGLTPSLHVASQAPLIEADLVIHPRHPGGRSSIPLLQADTILRVHEHEGPCVIVHPIRGISARLVCRDCGWRATCARCGAEPSAEAEHAVCRVCNSKVPLPLECPTCGGIDLGKSFPGIETLKRAWTKDATLPTVEWRDTRSEELDVELPERALVVVTVPSLLGGAGEDIRREERRLVTFRRLADRVHAAHGTLILHGEKDGGTPEEETVPRFPWQDWLTPEGVDRFREKEYQARRLFGYPPAMRLVKLIVDGSMSETETLMHDLQIAIKQAKVRGPFMVPHRTKTRSERHIIHLAFPPETSERELLGILSPFAKRAMIDLDPIAFFR